MKMKKNIIIVMVLALSVLINIVSFVHIKNITRTMTEITEVIELPEPAPVIDTLSHWEIFTLALMKVESEYNPNAVSSAGARGYFQMLPIYVREVNRIHHTDYTFDQVLDFETAYQIFDLMQQAHNPEYDMERALDIHNGKSAYYHKKVYKTMDQIRLYEDMRSKVKNIWL